MAVGFDMRDKPQQATCDTNVRHLRADPKMHLKGIHGIYIYMYGGTYGNLFQTQK